MITFETKQVQGLKKKQWFIPWFSLMFYTFILEHSLWNIFLRSCFGCPKLYRDKSYIKLYWTYDYLREYLIFSLLVFWKKKSRGFVIIEVYALSSAAWLLISSLTASKTLRLWQTTVGSCLLNSCLRFCLYLNVVTVVQFINWNQTFEAP